jgi:hypothetical protein
MLDALSRPSATRVDASTAAAVLDDIDRAITARVEILARDPEGLDDRLAELDAEWDVERVLEANASSLILAGLALTLAHDRRWLWLPAGVAAFLLQHAVQGWCPPLPVLRRLGLRTRDEIARERHALRTLRGDFEPPDRHEDAPGDPRRARALRTARRA